MKRFACLIFSLCSLLFATGRAYSAKRMTSPQEKEKAQYAYFEALRLKGTGQHAEAFDLLRHAIELDTTLAAAYSEVAGYYFTVRDAAAGYRSLLKAVKFAPSNPWYLLSAAECARQIRDYDRAVVLYARYLQIKPADIEVVSRLAETCMDKGEPQKAIEAYSRFEEQFGANENTILQKANIYYRMRDHEQSFEEMKSLIASHPHDVSYRLLLGDLYLESARYEEAYEMYMKVRELNPEEESLHLSLLNYYRLRKDKEAYWAEADTLLFRTSMPSDVRMSVLQYVIQD
ncbi:MAG: tetratricopeptide repeat protein, partial [Porphyromonadaceae bacterium]|nr:tetratricopeptide repeat protein [Porphyromonadaceae bacterium]